MSHLPSSLTLTFDDYHDLPELFGEQERTLRLLEEHFEIEAAARGSVLHLSGEETGVKAAAAVMEALQERIARQGRLREKDIDATLHMMKSIWRKEKDTAGRSTETLRHAADATGRTCIDTRKRRVEPFTAAQATYIRSMRADELVFGLGPAGTGKTYLAVAMAVACFEAGQVERIILSRPAVEAGERLGFLPGDLREKVDPYLRPLFDALYDLLPMEKVLKYQQTGEIEVAPLAFMRGRTLSHAFVILDEAQNASLMQMKMFLTRLGEGSRMVITGDLSQTDLPTGEPSGLRDAVRRLETIDGIGIQRFTREDVVRHPLTAKIIEAYEDGGG